MVFLALFGARKIGIFFGVAPFKALFLVLFC